MPFSIEENKVLIRRFFAAIESGDLNYFDNIVSKDYNDHLAGQSQGGENLRKYFIGLRTSFANLKLPIIRMVAEADHVAVLNRVRGTHKGNFLNIAPTGNSIDIMAFQLYRIENGQLAQHWEVADFATIMQQLQS